MIDKTRKLVTATMPVVGMMCAGCSAAVEQCLNGLDGVDSATVNLAGRTVCVSYDPSRVSKADMKRAVDGMGYQLIVDDKVDTEAIERRRYRGMRRRMAVAWCIAAAVMAVSTSRQAAAAGAGGGVPGLLRPRLLLGGMVAAAPRRRWHGHAGGTEHWHIDAAERVQHLLGRCLLGRTRH